MRRVPKFLLLLLTVVTGKESGKDGIVLKLSTEKNNDAFQHFYGEWLESPWGDLYQFRAGAQNWLTAREHCLSLNSDLVVLRNEEQLNWILSHYAPLNSRFGERLVQIGLYSPEGTTHEWKWVDGSNIDHKIEWSPGEPYDHSMEGKERCGLLSVEKRKLDDVDCGLLSSDYQTTRYVCQRSSDRHKQQQKSNNYIWGKIEQLFSFFGIGGTPANSTNVEVDDYEQEVKTADNDTVKFTDTSAEETSSEEEEDVIKTLATLPKIEGSGETAVLKELEGVEGSGQIVEKNSIETRQNVEELSEQKLESMISKMEEMIKTIDDLTIPPSVTELERTTVANLKAVEEKEVPTKQLDENVVSENIEDDFDESKSKDMPRADIDPPAETKEEDCDEEGSGSGEEVKEKQGEAHLELPKEKEDHIKEFLGVLRLFLDRAEHGDLRKLLDDKSGKTLLERMKNAIREANKREFEMLEKMEDVSNNSDDQFVEKSKMSATEQKEIYRKISSAVMKAAKQDAKIIKEKGGIEDNENYDLAKEKIEGKLTILKSAKESVVEGKHQSNEDYYGDYLDDNNVVKVGDGKKKEKRAKKDQGKKESEDKDEVSRKADKKVAETESENKEVAKEGAVEDVNVKNSKEIGKVEESGKEILEKKEKSEVKVEEKQKSEEKVEEKQKPKVVEETHENSGKSVKKGKTAKKEDSKKDVKSVKEKPAEAKEAEEESKENHTKKDLKTEKSSVKTKKVDSKVMEKISKKEAAEKVTLLPPMPTLPTLAPFSFPTIPTTPTTTPIPVTPGKFPTLEEILGNLNDNFKKLLAPPKPLPKPL